MPGVALAPGHVPGPDSAPGAGGSRREVRSWWGARGAHPWGWEQAGICVLGQAVARVQGGYSCCFIMIVVPIIN